MSRNTSWGRDSGAPKQAPLAPPPGAPELAEAPAAASALLPYTLREHRKYYSIIPASK